MNFRERVCAVPNCEELIRVPETYQGRNPKCRYHRDPDHGHLEGNITMRLILGDATVRKLYRIFN